MVIARYVAATNEKHVSDRIESRIQLSSTLPFWVDPVSILVRVLR
jgi:hypothetical protein